MCLELIPIRDRLDPDQHALDADPDQNPEKYCGSDPIRFCAFAGSATPHLVAKIYICLLSPLVWLIRYRSVRYLMLCVPHKPLIVLFSKIYSAKGKLRFRIKVSKTVVNVDPYFIYLWFLHESVSPSPWVPTPLGPFRIFRKFSEIFAAQGVRVVNTGGKWKKSSIIKVLQ